MPFTDYYKLLGISPDATEEEIKTAYRKLSKKFHPDLNEEDDFFTERFKDLQSAYELLSDKKQRAIYRHQYDSFYQQPGYVATDISKQRKYDPKLFLLLIPVALIAAAIFWGMNKTQDNSASGSGQPGKDYLITENVDSLIRVQNKSLLPAGTFKIILHQYHNYDTAYKSFVQLQAYGYGVLFLNPGENNYQIAMPFDRPLSDTTIIRDSIDQVFNTQTVVSF